MPYRAGDEGYAEFGSGRFEDREAELRRRYERNHPGIGWEEARPASQAAWERFDQKNPRDKSVDTYGNPRVSQ